MSKQYQHKKLGEICDIKNGKNQKKVLDPNGRYPIYGSGGIMGYANDYITKGGSTIVGRKGSINSPIYVTEDFWNVDTAFGLQPKENCNGKYLFYLCSSIDFTRYDKSVTIPSLTKSDLLQIPVEIPFLSEQHCIVEELDCLTGIIEKQKVQLEQLDSLAQSIFYDMFSDEISSMNGDIKIRDLATVKIGPFGSLLHKKDYIENGIPLINPIHMKDGRIFVDHKFSVSREKCNELENYVLHSNDIIMARRGEIGRCSLVSPSEDGFICGTGSLFIRPKLKCSSMFLLYLLNSSTLKNYLIDNAKGATMLNINCGIVEQAPIILPKYEAQMLFESKIEAIERQKNIIKEAIEETEELFNSRIDYYFN